MTELEPWLQGPFDEYARALEQGRMGGSVLLCCGSGLGAPRLADAMAELYLCHDPSVRGGCESCRSCQLLWQGAHPDFMRISATAAADTEKTGGIDHSLWDPDDVSEPQSSQRYVRVDALRRMARFLSESAVLGHGKLALVTDAERMQESAANAVLKTFEEPPRNTQIIMVTRTLEALLPTILSRAVKLTVKTPDPATALRFLSTRDPSLDPEDLALALALSSGAPYGALRLCVSGESRGKAVAAPIAAVRECLEAMASAFSGRSDFEQAIMLLKQLPKDLLASLLGEFVTETLKCKAYTDPASLPLVRHLPREKIVLIRAERLFKAWNDLKYVAAGAPLLESRAQAASLRAWFSALTDK